MVLWFMIVAGANIKIHVKNGGHCKSKWTMRSGKKYSLKNPNENANQKRLADHGYIHVNDIYCRVDKTTL